MTTSTSDDDLTTLEEVIESVQTQMIGYDADSAEFAAMTEQLGMLYAMAPAPKQKTRMSPDAVLAAVTNISGILLVLNFEKLGVVTSKAFGLLTKTRL